jgi:EpsI family protein
VRSNLRFAITAILLAGTGMFLYDRGRYEYLPPRQTFASFPLQVGNWVGTNVSIPRDALEVLGPGDFLARDYQDSHGEDPSVGLFLAYFPSQRAGDTFHSPKDCLPGAGWSPLRSGRARISLLGYESPMINRYLVGKGTRRGLVLYWYSVHGRILASEYEAKLYLIKDSLLLHRSDGSMIRVTTELRQNESPAIAQRRLVSLLSDLLPRVEAYIPR